MKRLILLCLLFVFSINVFADCPEFEVSLEDSKILGKSPDQIELNTINLSGVYNSAYFVNELIIIYFDSTLLPSYIVGCGNLDSENVNMSGSFDFDGTEVQANSKELKKYGISYIFVTQHSYSNVELIDDGASMLISSQGATYSGNQEAPLETYLFTWNDISISYIFSEKTSVLESEERLKKMEISIASNDFKTLEQQLSEFDFEDGWDKEHKNLPKKFSEKLWKAVHKEALALYKKGDKKEAAQLVAMILNNKPASSTSDLDAHYNENKSEYYFNYAMEALYENSKLLTIISDCAFFLEQGDIELEQASSIFYEIQREYPNRLVTYLNLADASWKLKRLDIAQENYETYVEMLLAKDKISVIPDYVFNRMEHISGKGLWENTQEAKVYKIKNTYLYDYGSHIIQASPQDLNNEAMSFKVYNRDTQKQFEISYEDVGYFFVGIKNDLIIIDEGSSINRGLMLYDLNTGNLVFKGGYYNEIKIVGEEFIYEDFVDLSEDQQPECPKSFYDMEQQYYGYVEKYYYNTNTRVYKATGIYRCESSE